MNILLYVMTLLLLLSAMTYAKIDSFRSLVGLNAGFVHYMEKTEREPISQVADNWYARLHPSSNATRKDEKAKRVIGSPRLSFYLFIDAEERSQNGEAYSQTRELTKQLLTYLYGEHKEFKEAIARKPNFFNELLDAIQQAAKELPETRELSRADDLSKLPIADTELHYLFYLMLNGQPKAEESTSQNHVEAAQIELEEEAPDQEAEAEAEAESEEAHSPAGFTSLLDYITLKNVLKIRVFLAPRPILMAIYGDAQVVDDLMKTRRLLFNEVMRGKPLEEATQEFMAAFASRGNASLYSAILEFAVTKTAPKSE